MKRILNPNSSFSTPGGTRDETNEENLGTDGDDENTNTSNNNNNNNAKMTTSSVKTGQRTPCCFLRKSTRKSNSFPRLKIGTI